jgi:ribosomal protein L21
MKTEIIINLKKREAKKKQDAGQQKMYIRITIHKSYLLLRDQQVSRDSPAVTDVRCSVNMLSSKYGSLIAIVRLRRRNTPYEQRGYRLTHHHLPYLFSVLYA